MIRCAVVSFKVTEGNMSTSCPNKSNLITHTCLHTQLVKMLSVISDMWDFMSDKTQVPNNLSKMLVINEKGHVLQDVAAHMSAWFHMI